MTITLFEGSRAVRGEAAGLQPHEKSRCRASGRHARIYPGPLGDLDFCKLSASAELGCRIGDHGSTPRLVADVLAIRSDHSPW